MMNPQDGYAASTHSAQLDNAQCRHTCLSLGAQDDRLMNEASGQSLMKKNVAMNLASASFSPRSWRQLNTNVRPSRETYHPFTTMLILITWCTSFIKPQNLSSYVSAFTVSSPSFMYPFPYHGRCRHRARISPGDDNLPFLDPPFAADEKNTGILMKRLEGLLASSEMSRLQVAQEASKLLASIESQYDTKPQMQEKPTVHCYVSVLEAWATCGTRDGPYHAEQILQRMERLKSTPGYTHIRPNAECYFILIRSYATNPNSSMTYRAEQWLDKLVQKWRKVQNDPSEERHAWQDEFVVKAYHVCLDAWSRWSGPSTKGAESANRAFLLLQRLKDLAHPVVAPDTFSYTSVLKAFARAGGKRCASQAESLIEEMESLYEADPLGRIQPNVVAYSYLIQSLAISGGGEVAALRTEVILTRMVNLHKSGKNLAVKPNTFTYQGVLTAWAKSGTGIKGAKRAEAILAHMQKLYQSGNHDVKPLTMSVNAVLEAWSSSGQGVRGALHAESILRRMDLQRGNGIPMSTNVIDAKPDTQSVNIVITAWTLCETPEGIEKAEGLLTFFDELKERGNEYRNVRPSVETYNIIIGAYAKSKNENAARKAEALLYRLINIGPEINGLKGRPNARSFGLVISCWARCTEHGSAERAEQLLTQMEKLYQKGNPDVEPNIIVYTTVIDAWAKSKTPNAVHKAQRIFDRLQTDPHAANQRAVRPNVIAFNALLNAWANSNLPDAPKRASLLLAMMTELDNAGFRDVKPIARTMNYAMLCFAKGSRLDVVYAVQAERLLDTMMSMYTAGNRNMMPDSFSFSTAMNAWVWSTSEAAKEGAVRIIQKMEDWHFTGGVTTPPHSITYNAAIRYFVDRQSPRNADQILVKMESAYRKGVRDAAPDKRTYGAILSAYAQSDDASATERALQLFDRMKRMSDEGNKYAKPDTFCYNNAIAALAKGQPPDAGTRAEGILYAMKQKYRSGDFDAKPDTITYSSVINALARSKEKDAAPKAMKLLTEMEDLHRSGDKNVVPNLISFNSVLNALSKGRTKQAALSAEELLKRMDELYRTKGMPVKPNAISYTSVINAWAATKERGASARAEALVKHMEVLSRKGNGDVTPDTMAFNKVILSWAKSGEEEAASRAYAILKHMESISAAGNRSAKPDGFSYKSVLRVLAKHGKTEQAEDLLNKLEKGYAQGDHDMQPGLMCYKVIAKAWEDMGNVERAKDLAKRLARVYKRQNTSAGEHVGD